MTSMESVPSIDARLITISVDRFGSWLERTGFASYDPYDVSATRYGLLARHFYYARNPLGTLMVVPLLAQEFLFPGLRRVFLAPNRYPTADAQLILAFLNLFRTTGEERNLETAEALAEDLIKTSISGYSGHCWGLPFDWQHSGGVWRKDTPYATVTPYCYEAFSTLADVTGSKKYENIAASAARFVYHDLLEVPVSSTSAAGSYSPKRADKILNSTAYRAFVLLEASRRFNDSGYAEAARRNLNFVLENQLEDGSWLYEIDGPAKPFIDHFHTCFVLKSLFKMNRIEANPLILAAIRRGYEYYRRELFYANDEPKSFAIEPRLQIVKLDMYNYAEAITLGTLLRDELPEAFSLALHLGRRLCREYQLPDGHFVTRVYAGGFRHTFPYIRWPQAQLFYALTNLLSALGESTRSACSIRRLAE